MTSLIEFRLEPVQVWRIVYPYLVGKFRQSVQYTLLCPCTPMPLVLPTKSGHHIMRSVVHTVPDLNSLVLNVDERGYKKFQCTQRYWILVVVSSGIFHQRSAPLSAD